MAGRLDGENRSGRTKIGKNFRLERSGHHGTEEIDCPSQSSRFAVPVVYLAASARPVGQSPQIARGAGPAVSSQYESSKRPFGVRTAIRPAAITRPSRAAPSAVPEFRCATGASIRGDRRDYGIQGTHCGPSDHSNRAIRADGAAARGTSRVTRAAAGIRMPTATMTMTTAVRDRLRQSPTPSPCRAPGEDARHVEKLKKVIPGDFIWFERDEKSYVIRDQATIDRARKALGSARGTREEAGSPRQAAGSFGKTAGRTRREDGTGSRAGSRHDG